MDLLRTKDIYAIDASEATIYKYFESKDHILESILMDYISNRPLEFDHKNIDTLEKFKSSLQKIMDLTFDNSLYRNNHIALILIKLNYLEDKNGISICLIPHVLYLFLKVLIIVCHRKSY